MNLFDRIDVLKKTKKRVIIAIDGPCASGKSTFTLDLCKRLDCNVFYMDDYFLPQSMKTKARLATIGGNVHYERILNELFRNITKETIIHQKFNCLTEELEEKVTTKLKEIVIVEGSYSLHKKLQRFYDLKILLTIEDDVQIDRLRKRNERLLPRFINEWIPLEKKYFCHEHLEEIVDFVIDTSMKIK